MKKSFLLAGALALSLMGHAQFEENNYIGAFAPAPAPMWTDTWTNWDPENATYPATNQTVSANITQNTTWTSDKVYNLTGFIYVTNGATLTIQPGTVIRSVGSDVIKPALIITRGSKIMAEGTAASPIVFTSNALVGERGPGDWGGVIILGAAPTNQVNTTVIEGGLDATLAQYGGTNAADNSGVFKYVRIEFGGIQFQPNQEINGLTLGGVGSGTVIDYVQCSFINDDPFEWFGGTVNAKHLVAYRGVDDDFDTDFGYSGTVQYGLAVRDPELSDQCDCSTSEGFESDNDAGGTAANPRTTARFMNMTSIGPLRGNTNAVILKNKFRRAARIRRNSQVSIMQSLLMDWPEGFTLDGNLSEAHARDGRLMFTNNVVAGMKTKPFAITSTFGAATFASQGDLDTWFNTGDNKTVASSVGLLTNPYNYTAPDYRPTGLLMTGIEDVTTKAALEQIVMFPNPASNQVEIALNAALANGTVNILNATGAVVATQAAAETVKVDVSGLAEGLYIVSVRNGNKVVNKTLVISK